MKKLYRKGTVHPSPSPSPSPLSSSSSPTSDHFFSLSYLPAAILALTVALSTEDKEVLAYLLSCSTTTTTNIAPFDFNPSKSPKKHNNKNNNNNNNDNNEIVLGTSGVPKNLGSSSNNNSHVTSFTCNCFTCYMTYWARWDSSPNRQLIHEIIDAFEDNNLLSQQKKKKQGVNKKVKRKNVNNKNLDFGLNVIDGVDDKNEGSVRVILESGRDGSVEEGRGIGQIGDDAGDKQGFARKMVSFIWGSVWG